ncbi:Rnt2 [Athelia psychrophila]|uniref:ribonuclease T2 n=1 Tax=Athelia psychrophila TaxID=1759441 RepID=A0A166VAU7_9AGAM|nr:Rnt2 [Fibularhizoctonia sp. CBS 109695]
MQEYWLNDDGTSEELWEHEWATHGTCYSTLEPSCFTDYTTGDEAVAFYETVVSLFKTLPTYQWLADSNITPSDSQTYEWADVEAALIKNGNGLTPMVTCDSGSIGAISWYFNVKGSLVDGDFVAIDSPEASTCSGSVKYPTKSSS